MVTRSLLKLSLTLAALIGAAQAASAQATPPAHDILSTFPESKALLYVNARRVIDEAMPRVVPQQQLDKMFADVQKQTSFDLRGINFVALGLRYTEPLSLTTPPDFVVMVKGTFNADALLSLARMAAGESATQETYKGRTINVFKLKKEAKPGEGAQAPQQEQPQAGQQQQQKGPSFQIPEVAVVSFDPNTVLVGMPGFVRAAVDAAEGGQGRVRADLVDLVAGNPDNLVSFGGDLPSSLVDLLKSAGVPQNPEVTRVVGSIRQLQTSVTMNANDFGAQTVVRTDTAESAQVLNGLVTMGLSFGRMGIEEQLKKVPVNKPREREVMQTVLDLLSTLRNAATGNELKIDVSIPQATVAEFVRKEMARQSQAKKSPQPAARRRAPRRRR